MEKSAKSLSLFTVLLLGLFLSVTRADANIITPPEIIPGMSYEGSLLIIGVGAVICVVAVISWIVIRAIRKKKNVTNK